MNPTDEKEQIPEDPYPDEHLPTITGVKFNFISPESARHTTGLVMIALGTSVWIATLVLGILLGKLAEVKETNSAASAYLLLFISHLIEHHVLHQRPGSRGPGAEPSCVSIAP
jgi:hypothetical protein